MHTSEFLSSLKNGLKEEPLNPDIWFETGYTLLVLGQTNKAIRAFALALQIDPEHTKSKAYISLPLLLHGDYEAGLRLYEWRHSVKNLLYIIPQIPLRRVNKSWKQNETLLIVCEQGFGDTIQFIRYAIQLQRMGISVIACVQEQLKGLMQRATELTTIIGTDEVCKITTGEWLPMLSLPLALGVKPGNPIISDPYIHKTMLQTGKWSNAIRTDCKPVIGIAWKGNPEHEKTISRGRSAYLEYFCELIEDDRYRFISLQKGHGQEGSAYSKIRSRFADCQDLIDNTWDFEETAAIISCCDIVITVDTCVAHLAGSMGVPVWILLKRIPEWRWGLNDSTSFWYPSAVLWRQIKDGDWNELIHRVHASLEQHFTRA